MRLDSWRRNTMCSLGPPGPGLQGRVRWFRGAYYISQPAPGAPPAYWQVSRLLLDGHQLSWQVPGTDTLRLAVLPPGVVRRAGSSSGPHLLLRPATRRQERQLAAYAGLWESAPELRRQP